MEADVNDQAAFAKEYIPLALKALGEAEDAVLQLV
jgi:hypothetical protein